MLARAARAHLIGVGKVGPHSKAHKLTLSLNPQTGSHFISEASMLNRRRAVQSGLAALGSLPLVAPLRLRAQGKPPVKIRYSEVVRSILYAPTYVAITQGFFKDAGLDVALSTAQ